MFRDKTIVVLLGTIDEGVLGTQMVMECEGYKTVSLHSRLSDLFVKSFCFEYKQADEYAKKLLKEFKEEDINNYLKSLKLPDKSVVITDNYVLASKCKEHLGAKVYRTAILGRCSKLPLQDALYDKVLVPTGVKSSIEEVI